MLWTDQIGPQTKEQVPPYLVSQGPVLTLWLRAYDSDREPDRKHLVEDGVDLVLLLAARLPWLCRRPVVPGTFRDRL